MEVLKAFGRSFFVMSLIVVVLEAVALIGAGLIWVLSLLPSSQGGFVLFILVGAVALTPLVYAYSKGDW